jgi:2OG-Fe(II) oxygenase superfamily
MAISTTVEWLSKAIGQAAKSAKFCVSGCLPCVHLGLEVDGLGDIALPMKGKTVKALVAACQVAPYGKGTQTLVDKKVRNTYELDPKTFRLSDEWNSAIADATRNVAEQLELPADQLEARLYKLLMYERGGFFLPHRDSEKHDRMVASMIVVLPNPFEGGRLIVRHGAATQKLTFDEAAAGKAPCFAAFYADCEHEVERVSHGVRLCLAYNLVLKPMRAKPSASANAAAPADVLAKSIGLWVAKQPAKPLVFALDHHYTQRGLSLDLLKGADRKLANLIAAAAEETNCSVHLAQVSRHLCQFADDGSFEGGYFRKYSRSPRGELDIGETYEDELSGNEWTDAGGKKQPWGDIAFDLSAIVSSEPIDDWKPTSEEYEGYTGNAGNTLDRWYHRSAIVVWHRDHHFDVIASCGAMVSIPLFRSMVAKLAKTPKKRLVEARNDCIQFARAIIAEWPRQLMARWHSAPREKAPTDDFPKFLLALRDRDTVALFLAKLAEKDEGFRLNSSIVAACREFGWTAFAGELKRLILATPLGGDPKQISFRDIEWLSAFCCETAADADRLRLAHELCALAVRRFCDMTPQKDPYRSSVISRPESVAEAALPMLLKALVACDLNEELSRVIEFVRETRYQFSVDDCQVPCLIALIPWSKERLGVAHPQLVSWLALVRQNLESATTHTPPPPADWTRPADVSCNCQYCARLKTFLADPTNAVGRIPAPEASRTHVLDMIRRHQCDVNHTLERKGSPYSLVLTKNKGSFERAVKRYEADRRHLKTLPVVE